MTSASHKQTIIKIPLQHIFDSVKQSLERLQLDYIDVLQCEFDPSAAFDVFVEKKQAIDLTLTLLSRRRCRHFTTLSKLVMSDTLE